MRTFRVVVGNHSPKFLLALVFFVSGLFKVEVAQSATVTLAWDGTSGSSISAYRVYQGPSSGKYTNSFSVGIATNAIISGLTAGSTYYFAVTSVTTNGLESLYSNEVQYQVPVTNSTPPLVALTSPANGSSYTAPATLNLQATVTTNGHTIAKVQFFNGSALIAEDTSPPYSASVTFSNAGTYGLSAKAVYDTSNMVASSTASVTITTPASPPAVAVTTPTNGTTFMAPANFTISASVITNGHTISTVQFYAAGTLLGQTATSPYSWNVTNLPAGSYDLTASAVYDAGSSITSAPVSIVVAAPVISPPWTSADIGTPGVKGSASGTNGSYTISGAGSLGANSDNVQFVYQPMNGRGELRTRVTSMQGPGGIAALMIRESLNAGASYGAITLSQTGSTMVQTRSGTGANCISTAGPMLDPTNSWLRVLRANGTFYAYASADGSSWKLVKSTPLNLAKSVYIGFIVASGSSNALTAATFNNVTVIP